MFDKITKIVGYVFFGGWAIAGTVFYIKAIIEAFLH